MTPSSTRTTRRTAVAMLALISMLACDDDPTGPAPIADSYELLSIGDGGGLPGTIPLGGGRVVRVTSGTLTLRADSTFELRLQATRDSATVSVPLPVVAASGRYTATRMLGDDLYDYTLALSGPSTTPDAGGLLGNDGFLSLSGIIIAGVPTGASFAR
jgi:hypothetical protein